MPNQEIDFIVVYAPKIVSNVKPLEFTMSEYIEDIVLIGPVGVGKTTVARCLAKRIDQPLISMDDVRDDYYRDLGYDANTAKLLYEKDGAASVWCYFKAFDPYSVERILEDYRGYIIDMGGGSTVHEHEDQLQRVKRALGPYRNVILLLPYEDREASLSFLDKRTGWGDKNRNINRTLLNHPSNYELATITIYTAERSPDNIAEEILEQISGE